MRILLNATLKYTDVGVLVVTAALLWIVRRSVERRRRNPRGLPLPPGPKGLPIVGNLFQLPQKQPWLEYDRMCKEHGDLLYLEAMGQPILMLGSLERANDILEKRSAVYSDRPVLPAFEMMDLGWSFSLMHYGQDWRNHRREFHKLLNASALARYQPIFDDEIPLFLGKLQQRPEDFLDHMRDLFGYSIMRVAYGFDDPEVNKTLLHDGETLLQAFGEAALPGRYLVNDVPMLRHVPAWVPGAGFRRKFEEMKVISKRVLQDSFERAKDDVRNGRRGNAVPSMAAHFIANLPEGDEAERAAYERVAKDVCAVAYGAGADTMVSSLSALFLALASNPDVQRKAQEELDSVIGSDRLPTLADQDNLPYIAAIAKEIGRWHPVAPLGFTHVTSRDDEYDGYFIPKGTYVMANSWAVLHDPEVYKDPHRFNPERFLKDGVLDPSVQDPAVVTFGYGRRICPGRFLGTNTLFLVTACVMSAFNIYPPNDENGDPIPLVLEATAQIVSNPAPFKVDVQLRSPRHAKLFSGS